MPRKCNQPITEKDIQGFKYLRAFEDLLEPLRQIPAHGNRQFHIHQYVSLLLLYFFNPVLTSLRGLQQATGLENVQKALNIKNMSLGAMSESAANVFDPELLLPIIQSVMDKIKPENQDEFLKNLPGIPIAVDGSFLRCLPKMLWAVFRTQSDKKGVRMHIQFDLLRDMPSNVDITVALSSEKKNLRKHLKEGALYVVDRGFIDYDLFEIIDKSGSFFVARLKNNSSYEVVESLSASPEDVAAGVICDQKVIMGSEFTKGKMTTAVRRVVIRDPEKNSEIILLTNTDLTGEQLSMLYRYRWQVELFFRWFKCILGCTHWLSNSQSGLTLQVYTAILASLLIRLWTGRKPTKRTFEMICLFFQGWASQDELIAHIQSLQKTV